MRSRFGLFARVVVAQWAFAGCLPKPEPGSSDVPVTRAEPLVEDGVERVARFSVSFHDSILDPDDAWLFRGELSDYHLGRINHRELPQTLEERRVAVNAWFDPGLAQTSVAPIAELVPGEVYSLAAPGWGRLAQVAVRTDSALPVLKRLWPPVGSAAHLTAIYCGVVGEVEATEFNLEPSHLHVAMVGGAGSLPTGERCVKLAFQEVTSALGWQVLPPLAAGALWDPLPLEFEAPRAREEPPTETVCEREELSLDTGCATVFDDRLVVRNGPEPMLYAVESESEPLLFALSPGENFAWRGLLPDSPQVLLGKSIDRFGDERPFELSFRTLPAAAHLVLNEVLANALGPEPASEWIELLNDGSAPAELGGLRLADGAGQVELPATRLDPGAYALLVRDDFVENGVDVPPKEGVSLVRVPTLGKNGLSNSGEALTLSDASGRVLSRIPAIASAHAGVSIARRSPSAPDDAPESFAEHAAPGASPGAENSVASAGAAR